ncbi:Kinesin member [Perkinsus chesapeaki]|uniref:Kinesin-like protein n=1 Tax=Perkinsus chesapeaki TaxID=330153 RepID=A0A7J6ME68_PERCH|nr:Kinesin member [Perkinsus chesapeaki]
MVLGRGNNVKVIVRTRPTALFSKDHYNFDTKADSVDLTSPEVATKKKEGSHGVDNQADQWHFQVDKLLVGASQQDVYTYAARDLVRSAFDGVNGAIIAYGHTGAGKTYTMVGSTSSFEHRGIIPRVLTDIFREKAQRPAMSIDISLSYLEIYNEALSDLLAPIEAGPHLDRVAANQLTVFEDTIKGVQVKGLRNVAIDNEEDALSVFYTGEGHRVMGETLCNKKSTRSHAILTVYITSRSKLDSSEKITYSKLHLVDLAGSERSKGVTAPPSETDKKEVSSINRSCAYLEQVVLALASKGRDHVPYRQSKLTYILKDSLGGNCKSVLVAAIWPEARHFEETAGTLRFACRMRRVSNSPAVNIDMDASLLIRKYEKDIKQLQQELEMHDILAGRQRIQYDEYTPEEVEELEKQIVQYLSGEDSDFQVESIRQVTEAFKIARRLYQQLSSDLASAKAMQEAGQSDANPPGGDRKEESTSQPADSAKRVGEEVKEGLGFSVGLAGDDGIAAPPASQQPDQTEGVATEQTGKRAPKPAPSRQVAFAEFKQQQGRRYDDHHRELVTHLKELKSEVRSVAGTINSTVDELEKAKVELAQLQASEREIDDSGNIILDEDEYRLLRELAEGKKRYHSLIDKHCAIQKDIEQCQMKIAENKRDLLDSFAVWCLKEYSGAPFEASSEPKATSDGSQRRGRDDIGEQFDSLESARVQRTHPDAMPFHRATKGSHRSRSPRK